MAEYIKKEDVIAILITHHIDACFEICNLIGVEDADINTEQKELKPSTFGFNLAKVCKENNIKIRDVANGTGISEHTIYNITKRGTKKPRGNTVQKVFDYLKERVPDLTM